MSLSYSAANQLAFRLPDSRPLLSDELIIDSFAGAGGESIGIEELSRAIERFSSLVRFGDGCWDWLGFRKKRRNGDLSYGIYCIRKRQFLAHRFSWMITNGSIPDGKKACHRCDNVACVRPDHLFIGSQAENLADMRAKGRNIDPIAARGIRHQHAKVNPQIVREIRALRVSGISLAKIGVQFGIHASTVHDIVTGRTWAEVGE